MKLTFSYQNVLYEGFDEREAIERGVPKSVWDGAAYDVRKAAVSSECRRRIYAVATAETQMNMAAASAVISAKTSSSRTDTENAVLAGLGAAIGWVGAMRGAAATLAADPAKDFTAGEHWPDVPIAAADIVGRF